MIEERQEVLRENLDECLRHFGRWFDAKIPPGKPGRSETMKPMINFFGASYKTIRRFLEDGSHTLQGEFRIKMMCYLDLHGYKVIEFERMASNSKILRNFAELIGFSIISADDAFVIAGYKGSGRLYEVLREEIGLSKDKEDSMWQAWKERKDILEARKEEAWKKYRLKILFKSTPKPRVLQQLVLSTAQSNGAVVGARHSAVLRILENSLVLLEDGLFEGLSESELANFAAPILRLSSHLSVLSSKVLSVKGDR